MKHKKLVTAISKCIAIGVIGIQMAHAGNSITVDSTSDQPEAGFTTLREAIESANGISGAEINFDPQVFSTPQTITLENGELLISSSMTTTGPGKDLLTIDGDNNSRIFRIDDDSDELKDVEISGLTLTQGNGSSPADTFSGGCILSFESLTLTDSIVTNCRNAGRGGGVFTRFGDLSLVNSSITENRSGFEGGGLYFRQAVGEIVNSTISNNSSISDGGGIFIERNADISISNSTLTGNEGRNSNRRGGGIFINNNNSSLTVENSTIFNNTGEGIYIRQPSVVNVNNSIIANNTNGDCEFSIINANSNNQNNLDTDGSCDVEAINHITVADPLLEPLANFGGLTATHRPLPGSPVIDMGDDLLCTELDQRGFIRPVDGDEDGMAICDIGAVELGAVADLIFIDGFDN